VKLHRLRLFDYRNFGRLDLELKSDVAIFVGGNAQGKSNLLEALYLLATMRAVRAETDVQLIRREMLSDVQPAARIIGDGEASGEPLKIEVAVVARHGANGLIASKTVKVNGAPKRLGTAVGRIMAVLFTADDLEMVTGSPSPRRKFLDTALSQVDSGYAVALRQYEKVLPQRNSLLKRIREGQAGSGELEFWDDEMARRGGTLLYRRASALDRLSSLAREAHAALASGEVLEVAYKPRLDPGEEPGVLGTVDSSIEVLRLGLRRGQSRDIAAGMTLTGPHRDDVELVLDGAAASAFASRAQQRTIALAIRLSEARFLREERGELPLLLLDDILSEMDADRRRSVLGALAGMGQMLITATDTDRFPTEFADRAQVSSVNAGTVEAVTQALLARE
jgi:DNA replication and repair protein RecF